MDTADDLWNEASDALMTLAVHSGIMSSTITHAPEYEAAREGWRSRMREVRDWARRQTEEIHDFAEAYDPTDK